MVHPSGPSDALQVFCFWLDKRRVMFGFDQIEEEMARCESLKESIEKILCYTGERVVLKPLAALWSDLMLLKALCQLPETKGRRPFCWPVFPSIMLHELGQLPLRMPVVSKPLITLADSPGAKCLCDQLSMSMKLLDTIVQDCEDDDVPTMALTEIREVIEEVCLMLQRVSQ